MRADCVEAYAPDGHETTVLALRTANEPRRGLERGEIVPYFQPIVDFDSGVIVGSRRSPVGSIPNAAC